MESLSLDESLSEENHQPRKILIAVDLQEHSEQIIAYSLLVTQRIFCEYDVLYCLETGTSKENAQQKMALLIEQIGAKYAHFANHSLKPIIHTEKPAIAIQQLHKTRDYNCVMVGTANQESAWEMGVTSKSILLTVPTTILVIPPRTELVFPNNIGVLIEKKDRTNFERLSAFNNFVAYDNIFINFIFFAKNQKIMEDEKLLIEEYKVFFESNFSFAFIIDAVQTYGNFFKYLEETYCTAAVLPWDESSVFHKSLAESNFTHFPCSPKMPVLYIKRNSI